MNRLRQNIWFLVAALAALWLVRHTLSNIVTQPWYEIPELGGDGAKNIFTYLYQCTQGHGVWFTGMNYPYGEHIVYTDGQPVLSLLLSCFHGITPGQALTVLWWLIGFSYVLAILFLYQILLRFRLRPGLAVLFACIIGIFTPQILRLQGHYALSYTCIIPMLFYWTVRYYDTAHWRYCLYFFLTGCITAFLHPYYAALMLVWSAAYGFAYLIGVRRSAAAKFRHIAPLLSAVALVLVFVALVMKLTDPVTDRPVTPFNTLYETCTRLKQLVTSFISPVWQPLLQTKMFHYVSDGGEGYAYLGVVTLVTLGITSLIVLLKSIRSRRMVTDIGTGFAPVWLLMAFGVLLFGMGIPFIWHLEGLMNYLAIFKQFRSLGRFSWISYYIFSVYTAVALNAFFGQMREKGKAWAGYALVVCALLVWSFETNGYINYARRLSKFGLYNNDMMFSLHEQNWEGFLADHHYRATDFQAILLLPFFHVGTEKLWVGYGNWLITLGSKAALQLHVPMINVMMSRSSWSQAKKQVKIAAGGYVGKPILRDISSDKPFLLMHFEEDSLNDDQKYLLESADYIGHFSQCQVYACYPARIAADDKRHADSVGRILPFMKHDDTVISSGGNSYINHFDGNTYPTRFFGSGVAPAITTDSAVVAIIPVSPPADSQLYEFSCWFLLSDKDPRAPNFSLELVDAKGRTDTTADVLTRQSTDNNGMWFRSGRYFYIHHNITQIRCKLMNMPAPSYLAMDEILLRPANALVISKSANGQVLVNNHLYISK